MLGSILPFSGQKIVVSTAFIHPFNTSSLWEYYVPGPVLSKWWDAMDMVHDLREFQIN